MPTRTDAGTDWETKEELSSAAAGPADSSVTAAIPAATAMSVRRIEEPSFIVDKLATGSTSTVPQSNLTCPRSLPEDGAAGPSHHPGCAEPEPERKPGTR